MNVNRRRLLRGVPAFGALASAPVSTLASDRPQPKLDVVVKGGHVIDPAQGLNAPFDIGLQGGRVAKIAADIPSDEAFQSIDATGRYVTPGLIDMHAHVADGMMPVSIAPDLAGLETGVTSILDAGSAGQRTFEGFRKHIILRAETRIYTLLNISAVGLVVTNELYLDPKLISVKRALRGIRENRDRIIGLKARVRGRPETLEHDLAIMKTVRQVADETGLRVMMHWTNEATLIDTLRPGDVMTHPFNPAYLNPSCIDPNGKIYPAILELPDRGIGVDLAHGSSFDWNIAEKAAEQGWYPDVLSTDMFTRYFRPKGVVGDLGSVMAKFLHLGLTLEQAVEKVTAAPQRYLAMPAKIGTLEVGSEGDLTFLEVRDGEFELTDSPRLKQTRVAKKMVVATDVIKAGRYRKLSA